VIERYREVPDYQRVIKSLIALVPDGISIECISGGERRDWLYSVPIAEELGVPHAWLFKSREPSVTDSKGRPVNGLIPPTCVHASELLNRGESFVRYWVPALETLNLKLEFACFGMDRSSKSINYLDREEVRWNSLSKVNDKFFEEAARLGLITTWSAEESLKYLRSPKEWIEENFMPFFPRNIEIDNKDPKSAQRIIAFCLERGLKLSIPRLG
jgi:orotate phosphoribosyltransferase